MYTVLDLESERTTPKNVEWNSHSIVAGCTNPSKCDSYALPSKMQYPRVLMSKQGQESYSQHVVERQDNNYRGCQYCLLSGPS